MTSSGWHNGTVRATRIAMAVGLSVAAFTLTACGRTHPQILGQARSSSSEAPADTAPSDLGPTVYGRLTVTITKTASASVAPKEPIRYTLIVERVSDGEEFGVPVGADGEFSFTERTGTYRVPAVQLESTELSADPVSVPLTAMEQLQFALPETGCVYGGHVQIAYGRVVSGSLDHQKEVVQKMANAAGHGYKLVYLRNGGLILTGGTVDTPAASDRPAAAKSCPVSEFTTLAS